MLIISFHSPGISVSSVWPVFDLNGFTLTGSFSGKDSAELRVLDHQSQLSMSAEAEFL